MATASAPSAAPAAELRRLQLHLAIWDDDIDRLQALLMQPAVAAESLESCDKAGNTPLLLAYRMGRTKMARLLLAAGAFPKARSSEGWEAIQIAALTANPDLVRESVLGYLAETDAAFARRLPRLQSALASMPDFELRMGWTFSSWVPLVSSMLPNDTYYLYKRGSSLRMDSTLLGMNGLRWERGSVSLLLWGSDMPRPGAMYVLDNEAKTAADARLAFTHPQDVHIQDWVRKLLTTKQKTTDFWSRDVVMAADKKAGFFGSIARGFTRLAMGNDTPRGRVSEGKGKTDGTVTPPESPGADGDGGASPMVHVDDPAHIVSDVGVWSRCVQYSMNNLCVRDLVVPAILPELKLKAWWKAEYSRQATEADMKEVEAATRGHGKSPSETAAASHHHHHHPHHHAGAHGHAASHSGGGGGHAHASSAAAGEEEDAPEKKLGILWSAMNAIRAGKINERNAASATVEELEGMGYEDVSGKRTVGNTVQKLTFEEYFGFARPTPDAFPADAVAAEAAVEGASAASPARLPATRPDGKLFAPTAAVCIMGADQVTSEDKILDLKVQFSREFPIPVEQFIPVAEIMARTGRHAENFRRFFDSKMPQGAGFPVRFTIPVFPTITATITFESCDTRRSPPASMFEIPADYKMGAYQEKGWIRQV